MEKQETINTQNAQTMADLKDILTKFTSALSFQEKDKFPCQPQQNPKVQVAPEANTWIKSKSVITLRSGKVIEKPILERCEKDDKLIYEDKEVVEPKHYMKGLISPQHFHLLMP